VSGGVVRSQGVDRIYVRMEDVPGDTRGIYRSDNVFCLAKGVIQCWPHLILGKTQPG